MITHTSLRRINITSISQIGEFPHFLTEALNCRDLWVQKYSVIAHRHLVDDILHFINSSNLPVTRNLTGKPTEYSKKVSGNDLSCNDVLAAGISKHLALAQKHFEFQVLLSLSQVETLGSDVLEQEKSDFVHTNVTSNAIFQT